MGHAHSGLPDSLPTVLFWGNATIKFFSTAFSTILRSKIVENAVCYGWNAALFSTELICRKKVDIFKTGTAIHQKGGSVP